MRWTPKTFWKATPPEFFAMLEGFGVSRGGGRGGKAKPPTVAEMKDWIEKDKRGEKF